MRQAQLAALTLPNVVWAATIDLVYPFSAPDNIHPTNKQGVGARLAAQILNNEYHVGTPGVNPTYGGFIGAVVTGRTVVEATFGLNGCGAQGLACVYAPAAAPPGVSANITDATFSLFIGTTLADATWMPATATFNRGTNAPATLLLSVHVGGSAPAVQVFASKWGRAQYPLVFAFGGNGLPLTPWCFLVTGQPCYLSNI